MAEEKTKKIIIEREYVIPLRRGWQKVPEYKRANKAVKTLKEFLVRHMKVYDRDLRKIRVDILLNNEIRFRGMRKPPATIKVKAIKYEDGFVDAKLVDIPKHIEFQIAREAKRKLESLKKEQTKSEEKKEIKEEIKKEQEAEKKERKTDEKTEEKKEKQESSKEAEMKLEKENAKIAKHTTQSHQKAPKIHRKALKK